MQFTVGPLRIIIDIKSTRLETAQLYYVLAKVFENKSFVSGVDVFINISYFLFLFLDLVLSLPDGWPQFKNRPWRRRSCELVQSTSSCVRKAVAHLHQLQDLVDLLHKTDNFEGEGRSSKRRSSSISGMLFP